MKDDELTGEYIDKNCPKCGATLLGNKVGDEWCSFIGGRNVKACDFGLDFDKKRDEIEQKINQGACLTTHRLHLDSEIGE